MIYRCSDRLSSDCRETPSDSWARRQLVADLIVGDQGEGRRNRHESHVECNGIAGPLPVTGPSFTERAFSQSIPIRIWLPLWNFRRRAHISPKREEAAGYAI